MRKFAFIPMLVAFSLPDAFATSNVSFQAGSNVERFVTKNEDCSPLEVNQILGKIPYSLGVSIKFAKDGRHAYYSYPDSFTGSQGETHHTDLYVVGITGKDSWKVKTNYRREVKWSDSCRSFAFDGQKITGEFFFQKNENLVLTGTEVTGLGFLPGTERIYLVKKGSSFCTENQCIPISAQYGSPSFTEKIFSPDGKWLVIGLWTKDKSVHQKGYFIVDFSGDIPSGKLIHGEGPVAFYLDKHEMAVADVIKPGNVSVRWGHRNWGPFLEVQQMAFSPGGDHLAFWAKKSDRWESYVDGEIVFSEPPRRPDKKMIPGPPVVGSKPTWVEVPNKPLSGLHRKGGDFFEEGRYYQGIEPGMPNLEDARYGSLFARSLHDQSSGQDYILIASHGITNRPGVIDQKCAKRIDGFGDIDRDSLQFSPDGSKLLFGDMKRVSLDSYAIRWNVVPINFLTKMGLHCPQ